MRPADFRRFVHGIAARVGAVETRRGSAAIISARMPGAQPAEAAMERAQELVAHYVAAGFRKIHLDCSMPCADDPSPLPDESSPRAPRGSARSPSAPGNAVGGEAPVYVIGTEVPVPGGADDDLTSSR